MAVTEHSVQLIAGLADDNRRLLVRLGADVRLGGGGTQSPNSTMDRFSGRHKWMNYWTSSAYCPPPASSFVRRVW